MSATLQTKVSVFVTLIILFISSFGTYLFTSAHQRSKEREFTVRGSALAYALSKAAEEGLVKEDLNLIKKAAAVIKAPDVTRAQVFSNIWDAVDAYPLGELKTPPAPEAVQHFEYSSDPLVREIPHGYDFYEPIFFRAFDSDKPVTIGFVRLTLSSSAFERELNKIAVTNISVSLAMTLLAILMVNLLIRNLVVRPVASLHDSIARFREGGPPGDEDLALASTRELHELSGAFRDLFTSVREKEEKLIESDRRIRSLFERVEHAVFRTDETGTIREANGRFRQMFGDAVGLCDIMIGEIGAASCLKRAAEANLHIEEKAVTGSGEEIVVSLSLYAERNEAKEIVGFDGYIIDITDKKRLEERLIRSQKLEAVGTLAAGMAHDFNNLLTAILGYSGIMLKVTKEDDAFHRPITVIHEAAKRGAALGKKILAVTRKDKMEAKPVDVNDLVKNAVDLLQSSMPKNIEIVTKLDPSIPRTTADPSQLHQVVINLAVNARDAMPEGGRLTLETAVANPANGLSGIVPPGGPGFIKFSVSDTGMGIDTSMQSKIFDPFFTTKDVGKGTGLGLYIVHSIVSNHGGYINVYSEKDQGTRFNIYLPITEKAAVEPQPENMDITGTETILVIDDELAVRELCKDMLTPLGYTVLLADSGSTGVNLYREKKSDIALVILDMIMPRMGGNEVFHALRTIKRDACILLYSGYSHSNFAGISDLMQSGASGFVQKPFSLQDLGAAVRKAIAGGQAGG